jgi:hypothetical protein
MPRRSHAFLSLAAILLMPNLSYDSFAQDNSLVLAPHKPIAPRRAPSVVKNIVATQRSIVGGPWMLDPNMKSTLYLRNSIETDNLVVTPVLYLSNGKKVVLSAVNLEPAGIATVSIGDALLKQGIAPYANLKGYVEIVYTSSYDPLCATIVNVDTVHSVIFTYGFRPTANVPMTQKAMRIPEVSDPQNSTHRIDGVWWKQSPAVSGFVSLSNVTDQNLSAQLTISGPGGSALGTYPVSLAPHATQVVDLIELRSASTSAGGAQVVYDGSTEGVLVSGWLEDIASGYSASMGFRPFVPLVPVSKTTTLTELGLMNGAPDPMMSFPPGTEFSPFSVIRNVSSDAVSLTPEVFWMEKATAHRKALPDLTIYAAQTVMLDVHSLLQQAGLSAYNGVLNLTFKTKSSPLALILASGSVDRTGTYVFQVVPHTVSESAAKTITYWSTANDDDTMVTVWNPADEAQDFLFTLHYTGGSYVIPLHLESRASRFLTIASIIRDQAPDINGQVIPSSITNGSARISGVQADNEQILVDIDSGTFNVRKATCSYYCISCDGAVYPIMSPVIVPFSISSQLWFRLHQNTGYDYDYTYQSNWSSSSDYISSITQATGLAAGNNYGGFTAYATATQVPVYNSYYCAYNASCPYVANMQGSNDGNVTDQRPVIYGIFPSDWTSGTTTPNVTFSGQYFGNNPPTLQFDPDPGITYLLKSYNDTAIVADITVPGGTPDENVNVTVTNNGYNGNAFASGGGAVTPASTPVYARVHAPLTSPEVTVIAWLDGSAPDLNNLPPNGANSALLSDLANYCSATLVNWSRGIPADLWYPADVDYANRFLMARSANSQPPPTITSINQFSKGDFRLFNDWGNGTGGVAVGNSPDPCGSVLSTMVAFVFGGGEKSQYEGTSGVSGSGKVYKVADGRVGKLGQTVSQTINHGRTVPWIYSVIAFDQNGNPTVSDHATFPTYYVYISGVLHPELSSAQSPVNDFVNGYDATNEGAWSPVP